MENTEKQQSPNQESKGEKTSYALPIILLILTSILIALAPFLILTLDGFLNSNSPDSSLASEFSGALENMETMFKPMICLIYLMPHLLLSGIIIGARIKYHKMIMTSLDVLLSFLATGILYICFAAYFVSMPAYSSKELTLMLIPFYTNAILFIPMIVIWFVLKSKGKAASK